MIMEIIDNNERSMFNIDKVSIYEQELLILLMEEASEVIKECSKCIRFGYNYLHSNGHTSLENLQRELLDFALIKECLYEIWSKTDNKFTARATLGYLEEKHEKLRNWTNAFKSNNL